MTTNMADPQDLKMKFVQLMSDPDATDESRLKAAEQISDQINFIADGLTGENCPKKQILDKTIEAFLNYLETTEPQFISERPCQKLRKMILEMIHRLPAVDALRAHVPRIIKIMFRLFETDNEENVGIVLRIIVELHKAHKPEFIMEIFTFLEKVKNLYSDIKNVYDLNSMFEERRLVVKDLNDPSVGEFLKRIHTIRTIEVESPQTATDPNISIQSSQQQTSSQTPATASSSQNSELGGFTPTQESALTSAPSSQSTTSNLQKTQTYTLIPKASRSIRVMSELPIIVVLLYQMYKPQLQQPLEQLLPLVLETTVLRPTEEIRKSIKTSEKMDKEIYVEFISAQIKCLSFVAYLVRMYTTTVGKHYQKLTQGLLALLKDCPHECASVRKELIAASKYIFQSELRDKFIEHLHVLCNDDFLVGTGWTVHETLRPQAYHILVDLLTNFKGHIKLKDLAAAVNLFAKNLHDNTLVPQVQLMSCKAFNNLVSYTINALADPNIEKNLRDAMRELLMRMIEIYVLKFKNIAVFQLPNLKKRIKAHFLQTNPSNIDPTTCHNTQQQQQSQHPQQTPTSSAQNDKDGHHGNEPATSGSQQTGPSTNNTSDRHRIDTTCPINSSIQLYNIVECKTLIRSLIIGCKTAIEAIPNPKNPNIEALLMPDDAKVFNPKETIALVRLLKYGLITLDVFTLTAPTIPLTHMTQMNRQAQQNRNKEEKDLMESFASIFTKLHPLIFHEIFSKMIHFVVVRSRQNNGILNVVNFIVGAPQTSPIFSTILSEYLIERMEQMGSSEELSILYLRMFRMIFASVALYPADNEQMLKPLLHSIVNKSVELALSAKDPYNYFLLLRALFRSIGGGSHDMLYAEFLPLLPNLLQGLNSFQSGQHRQHMKDLFTELCLTVPVRLSSLMPFMPTLIYPLVSALNGPNTLVSQGLRTLELCVDNLGPDYLYDLLQPVRAELMQSLWKTVRHPADVIAQNCLRVLGKFGGNNRRMLIEPQKLTYIEQKEGSQSHGITIVVHFQDQKASINLPIDKAIQVACEHLKNNQGNYFYKHHSWETIKGFIEASIGNPADQGQKLKNFFSNPNLATAHIPIRRENIYNCQDQVARNVYKMALVSMMMAASTPNLKNSVIPFMNAVVRHHVMLSIGLHLHPQQQQIGSDQPAQSGMDPFALVDALAEVIGHDDKEICKSGYYVMVLMVESVTMLLGTRERACELPLINYLVKQMVGLCYSQAWYTKMGGCIAIRYFTDNMPLGWLLKSLSRFVRALLRIMNDLTGELSSGVVDMAQTNLERLLNVCVKPIVPTNSEEATLAQAQTKAITDVTDKLVREFNQQNTSVRTQSMKSIELIAKLSDKSVAQIIEPHADILRSMFPFLSPHEEGREKSPFHLLDKQPVRSQIGIIDGSTFCTNLEPRVFVINPAMADHRIYLDQLIRICESDDMTLKKLQCYSNITSLAPVRKAAINALASLHYIKDYEHKIFRILLRSTESHSTEIQEEAFKCLEKYVGKVELDQMIVQAEVSPVLIRLKDPSMWDMQSVKRLTCFAKLFPSILPENYCSELQKHLYQITESAINDVKKPLEPGEKCHTRTRSASEKIKICAGIIELMVLIPNVSNIREMVKMCFKVESALMMESGSQLRVPLKKFLRRLPDYTITILVSEQNLQDQQVYRLLHYILKGEDGKVFRDELNQQKYYLKLLQLTSGVISVPSTQETVGEDGQVIKRATSFDLRYQAILIISIMIKYDVNWLVGRKSLVDNLKQMWCSEEFHLKHDKVDTSDYAHWKEPKLLMKCLLNYFQIQTEDVTKDVIDLLFQLLRAFIYRYPCDFEFFRIFLEKTVIETYSIEWKRNAFAKFVVIFNDPNYPQKLKAKILQHIIIPCFAHSFQKGFGEALLGGPPNPERENPNNLVHMFINKVIDPILSNGDSKKFIVSDGVRILLLQFSSLLVDQASAHIPDSNKRRLKKLVTFALPCLVNRTAVDPAVRYHGHYLLSHIIVKFSVRSRIIIQVLMSLLKASTPDARLVIKQALDILLPAIPSRLEEGNSLLLKWTKKIIIEEGHTINQLIHMLQLIVRHYRLYYPIRGNLIPLMINSIQRLGYSTGGTIENRRTAVDLCEVIMRWEMCRNKEFQAKKQLLSAQQQAQARAQIQQQQHQLQLQSQQAAMAPPSTPTQSPGLNAVNTTANQPEVQPNTSSTKNDSSATQPIATPKPSEDSQQDKPLEGHLQSQTTSESRSGSDKSPKESGQVLDGDKAIKLEKGDDLSVPMEIVPPQTKETEKPSTTEVKSEPNSEVVPMEGVQSLTQPQGNKPVQQQQQQALPAQLASNSQSTTAIAVAPALLDSSICEPMDQKHIDAILNALLRLACIVNPDGPSPTYGSYKILNDRCISLIKKILQPEALGGTPNVNFAPWMSDLLMSVQNPNCNVGSISGALELLTYLCGQVKPEAMLMSLKSLTDGIVACARSHNSRIIRSVSNLIQRVMTVFPTPTILSPTNNPPSAPHVELEPLYNFIHRVIMSGLSIYETTPIRQPDQQHQQQPSQQMPTATVGAAATGASGPNARERDNWQVALFSSLMLLKAACCNNISYIDRVMPNLIRVIQKMTREHINHMVDTTPMNIELLILGLDLVKNRLGIMSPDLRKQFIQQILSNLIESPTSDVKVLKGVVRIVEEWMKQKQSQPIQGPNLREKTLLLIKLMLFIEKRFPHDAELNSQFLELIYYVYRDEELKATDLTTKLESAFMSGLRCVQPTIRAKFFQIFDQSVKQKLYERLMYIVCAQNWQQIGCHFWIQQCIEFILAIATAELPISTSDVAGCLPPIPTQIDLGSYNPSEYDGSTSSLLTMLSNDANTVLTPPDDWDFVSDYKNIDNLTGFLKIPQVLAEQTPRKNLLIMVNRQAKFLDDLKRTKTGDLLQSITQLCHMSVDLAKATWINMFPRIWKVLNDQQMTLLGREIIPFLCSGAHIFQRDCNPSAVGAFMEAVSRCSPPIHMRPILIKYLGKNHNIWHRAALMLEESLKDKSLETCYPIPARSNKSLQQDKQSFDIITLNSRFSLAEEAVESISDILELLREEDLWCGLWQRKALYEETRNGVLYEQQGFFSDAQECYENAMDRQRKEFDQSHMIKPGMKSENRVWEKHWIRCTKELYQWDSLLDYGSSKACLNPNVVMESAWRVPNWPMMKEALCMVEENCPPSQLWRLHLFKGYSNICYQQTANSLQLVDDCHLMATSYCIQTWKKLPHIITNAHIPLLQASQQLLELHEAKCVHMSLCGMNRIGMHELRAILKGWPKRVPILFDDVSYWSDILTWRQHQYQTIVAHFEAQAASQQSQAAAMSAGGQVPLPILGDGPAQVAMQGTHFSAQGIISFGTVCRKQGSLALSLELLSRIHTIPRVPVFDCFLKIRQQIKCYLQMPVSPDKCELLDGIEVIDCTNLAYFPKEYQAEFYTYKGIFLSRLGRHEEANKVFSMAAQMNDSIPKIWAAWGDFLESRFTGDFTPQPAPQSAAPRDLNDGDFNGAGAQPPPSGTHTFASLGAQVPPFDSAKYSQRQMEMGVSAMMCYLQASKYYPESRARKYLAKVLWLLSFDNQKGELVEVLNKFTGPSRETAIPPHNWVVWIPQILQSMMLNPEPEALRNLLVTIGKHSPQAVYFPVRTLLFTLRVVYQHLSSQQPTLIQQLSQPPMMARPIVSKVMPSPGGLTPSYSMDTTTPTTPGGSQQHQALASTSPATQTPATPTPSSQQQSQAVANAIAPSSPQSNAARQRQRTISRCLDIAKRLGEAHPTIISSLEGISDQLVWLRDFSYEEVARQIHQALSRCYAAAFENANNITEQTIPPQTLNFIRKLNGYFGGMTNNLQVSSANRSGLYSTTVELLQQRHQQVASDPEFQQTRLRFRTEFDDSLLPSMKLITLIGKLQNWINILAQKKKAMTTTHLIEDKCRFLSNFSQHTADVEIPGDALMPKSGIYYVRIARFIPEVHNVEKHNTTARRLLIRGHNGKIYPYLVVNDSCVSDSRREERVLQMLRLLNQYLLTRKETGKRFLQFTVPRVVAISPGLRLLEDNPSSLSLIDILKRRINLGRSTAAGNELDQDSPITEYYDRLVKIQSQVPNAGSGTTNVATPKNIRDIMTDIQNKMIGKNLLRDWASQTYLDATDYWVFRSQFTYQLAMVCFAEYIFHLTRMMPESIYVHQDTGSINVAFYKFDLDETTSELRENRPVPFRLTPNLAEFITPTGISGPFRGAIEAVAACLSCPKTRVISIIRAILRDEMLFRKRGQDTMENEALIQTVNRATSKIYQRLENCSADGQPLESQIGQLILQAQNPDQLCQMDPAWHPWL